MAWKDLKKDIRWLWKTELGENNSLDKPYQEEKVLALNARKINHHKGRLFKGTCKKYGKYGHKASN